MVIAFRRSSLPPRRLLEGLDKLPPAIAKDATLTTSLASLFPQPAAASAAATAAAVAGPYGGMYGAGVMGSALQSYYVGAPAAAATLADAIKKGSVIVVEVRGGVVWWMGPMIRVLLCCSLLKYDLCV